LKKSRWTPKWHGEVVQIEHINVLVTQNKEKPLFWYNFECELNAPYTKAMLPAIEITTQEGNTFIIANHNGIGLNKVRKGGWPDQPHFSFDEKDIVQIIRRGEKGFYTIDSFCERDYSDLENQRRLWQKENFPEEFEKSEALRKMLRKSIIYGK